MPKVERSFHIGCDDLKPTHRIVAYPGTGRYPVADGIEAVPLTELMAELALRDRL